jgi:hypothetical protein
MTPRDRARADAAILVLFGCWLVSTAVLCAGVGW